MVVDSIHDVVGVIQCINGVVVVDGVGDIVQPWLLRLYMRLGYSPIRVMYLARL